MWKTLFPYYACVMAFATSLHSTSSMPSEPILLATENTAELPSKRENNRRTSSVNGASTEIGNALLLIKPIAPFTGKIIKNKVRLRSQATMDSAIVRTLSKDDMLIVVGEAEDFFAVLPPKDLKAYVFRTFILDQVVEGSHVNVRLEPAIDATVIAQLNSGDRVEGTVSPQNSKWMEITPPDATRFFVAKEFVEKIGDRHMLTTLERRRQEVINLLSASHQIEQQEMAKSFNEINIDGVVASYNKVIKDYAEFPVQVAKAKDFTTQLQEAYRQKKIAYLESTAQQSDAQKQQLNSQILAQQERLNELEKKLQKEIQEKSIEDLAASQMPKSDESAPAAAHTPTPPPKALPIADKMQNWHPLEIGYYENWKALNGDLSMLEFYQQEQLHGVKLSGIVEAYNRPVKNRPGDFILVAKGSNLPIAFLYSTQVNLQEKLGQEVTILAAPRANNNFAFPAYHVLSIE